MVGVSGKGLALSGVKMTRRVGGGGCADVEELEHLEQVRRVVGVHELVCAYRAGGVGRDACVAAQQRGAAGEGLGMLLLLLLQEEVVGADHARGGQAGGDEGGDGDEESTHLPGWDGLWFPECRVSKFICRMNLLRITS